MNEEYELEPIDEPATPEPAKAPAEPEFATKDDLKTLLQQLVSGLQPPPTVNEAPEPDDPLHGYDPEFANNIRRALDQQAQAIHAEYAPILKGSIANQAAQAVAGDMGPDVQQYISRVVARMEPRAAKAMIDDPAGLEMLHTMAVGHQAKAKESIRVPRTHEPGSGEPDESLSFEDRASLNSFMTAFGIDRKRASELYRQAQRGTR